MKNAQLLTSCSLDTSNDDFDGKWQRLGSVLQLKLMQQRFGVKRTETNPNWSHQYAVISCRMVTTNCGN